MRSVASVSVAVPRSVNTDRTSVQLIYTVQYRPVSGTPNTFDESVILSSLKLSNTQLFESVKQVVQSALEEVRGDSATLSNLKDVCVLFFD